ncbi:MAG: hypothetical protein EU548_08615 [Promethearchaeota archaeon]|nr:MAG: hypothetical protein EU548_08615 [Candidatus Lokiarchaeota archaeon]
MNFCPYCGVSFSKYKSIRLNYCPKCGEKLTALSSIQDQVQCGICHQYIVFERNRISCSYCGNHFHYSCVGRWLMEHNACPICQNVYVFPRVS